ncbi:hypothetical protein V8E36_006039 [Tilletia maclaganii]
MVDWNDPIEELKQLEVIDILLFLSFGFGVRELLFTSSFDRSILLGRRPFRWPQIFYFTAKISWLLNAITAVMLEYSEKRINCSAVARTAEVAACLLGISSSGLLACRAFAVYNDRRDRLVASSVLLLFAIPTAVMWVLSVGVVESAWVEGVGAPWQEGACLILETKKRGSWRSIATIVFDTVAAITLIVGVIRLRATTTRLGTTLVRHGMVYVLATCFAQLLYVGFVLASPNPIAALLPAEPTSVIVMMACTRLYVDLVQTAQPSHT